MQSYTSYLTVLFSRIYLGTFGVTNSDGDDSFICCNVCSTFLIDSLPCWWIHYFYFGVPLPAIVLYQGT